MRLTSAQHPASVMVSLLPDLSCSLTTLVYGWTHHKKKIPIDGLGGSRCQNQKTILRNDIEDRVLACLPAAFLHLGIFDKVATSVTQRQTAKLKSQPSQSQQLKAELTKAEQEQKNIIQQIRDRVMEGRPRLAALGDMLDRLEEKRNDLSAQLTELSEAEPDMSDRLSALRAQINPETVQHIVDSLLFYLRDHADTTTKQPFVDLVRQFVQKVVIGKTPGHQPASLEVHGRIASILGAMEATTILEERFKLRKRHDYLTRVETGELDTEQKQKKLLDAYAEELSVKRLEWANLQVSVVAGAGFEPAAFRL